MVERLNKALWGKKTHLAVYSATLVTKLFLVPERSGTKTEFSKIALFVEYSTANGLSEADLHGMSINRPGTALSIKKHLYIAKISNLAFKWLLVPARTGTKSKIHKIVHVSYSNKTFQTKHVNKQKSALARL